MLRQKAVKGRVVPAKRVGSYGAGRDGDPKAGGRRGSAAIFERGTPATPAAFPFLASFPVSAIMPAASEEGGGDLLEYRFDHEADYASEDWETRCTGSPLPRDQILRAAVGRGMHYLANGDSQGVRDVLAHRMMTEDLKVDMFYCFHASKAAPRDRSGGWAGPWVTSEARSASPGGGGGGLVVGGEEEEEEEEEVSSRCVTAESDGGEKQFYIEEGEPQPRRPRRPQSPRSPRCGAGSERWIKAVKDAMRDILRYTPRIEPSIAFRRISARAGLESTTKYMLRCVGPSRVLEVLSGHAPLERLADALRANGVSGEEIEKAALNAGYRRRDVEEAIDRARAGAVAEGAPRQPARPGAM